MVDSDRRTDEREEVRIVERRERKGKELSREMVVLFKMKPE